MIRKMKISSFNKSANDTVMVGALKYVGELLLQLNSSDRLSTDWQSRDQRMAHRTAHQITLACCPSIVFSFFFLWSFQRMNR